MLYSSEIRPINIILIEGDVSTQYNAEHIVDYEIFVGLKFKITVNIKFFSIYVVFKWYLPSLK